MNNDRFKDFVCLDCKVNTHEINEYYMVTDELWKLATSGTDGSGMLCIGCLEDRLQKYRAADDKHFMLGLHCFIHCPVNCLPVIKRSERLQNRFNNF